MNQGFYGVLLLVAFFAPTLANSASPSLNCAPSEDPWLDASVAARQSDLETLRCAIQFLPINGFDPSDLWEDTLLHFAAKYDQPAAIDMLLQRGALPEVRNAVDHSPLLAAAKHGAHSAATALLAQGADVHTTDADGRTPLFWAIAADNESLVALFLQHGADPDLVIDLHDRKLTPRSYAKTRGHQPILNLIDKQSGDS